MRFGGVLDMVGGLFLFCMLQKFLSSGPPKMPSQKNFGPDFPLFQGVKFFFFKNSNYHGLAGRNTPNGLLICLKHLRKVWNTFQAIFERKQKIVFFTFLSPFFHLSPQVITPCLRMNTHFVCHMACNVS